MPVRMEHETPHAGAPVIPAKRTWLGIGLRIVRNAAIAVGFMALVPIAVVGIRGRHIWGSGEGGGNVRSRVGQFERVRPYRLPADASITPMQAGLAFASLQSPPKEKGSFRMREPASRPAATWRDAELTPVMFPTATTSLYHGPNSQTILEAAVKGFSPEESAYLRTLATAPIWRTFDVVARAPAADLLGGRFEIPFPEAANVYNLPMADFKSTKELAYAAVSRAAYHMSLGQRDSAEAVLRSIISFGFVLVDNGTTWIDALIGNVIVGVGRDGLQRFYTITNDPRASDAGLAPLKKTDGGAPRVRGQYPPPDEVRARLIAAATTPGVPHAVRYEALTSLSVSACTNVPELLFGRRQDVDDAIAKARRELARYPSERALVDLIGRFPTLPSQNGWGGPLDEFTTSAGTVAGAVLRNPRLATCARIASNVMINY